MSRDGPAQPGFNEGDGVSHFPSRKMLKGFIKAQRQPQFVDALDEYGIADALTVDQRAIAIEDDGFKAHARSAGP